MRNIKYIIGIDEAGRGPLAGPLAVAGVLTTASGPAISNFKFLISKQIPNFSKLKIKNLKFLKGIKDSKKLSARQREEWYKKIKSLPRRQAGQKSNLKSACTFVSHKTIDRVGITKAAKMAVAKVLRKFSSFAKASEDKSHIILLDGGLRAPNHYIQKTIIRGDEKIPLIAAASIIAKVRRDKFMRNLHKKFPHYCFDRHKGYATKLHYKMLKKHGLCPFHRRTFCK